MEEELIDQINLTNEDYVKFLLKYLQVLQAGRVKPNSKTSGSSSQSSVWDSIDNFGDIHVVKGRLNEIFGLDQDKATKVNLSKSTR